MDSTCMVSTMDILSGKYNGDVGLAYALFIIANLGTWSYGQLALTRGAPDMR